MDVWTCSKCGRIFKSANQPHSCKKVSLEKHFEGKEKAKELFDSSPIEGEIIIKNKTVNETFKEIVTSIQQN